MRKYLIFMMEITLKKPLNIKTYLSKKSSRRQRKSLPISPLPLHNKIFSKMQR